ncbi:hypothetical protein EZS27_029784 [termite gut metagenome]|uniref:Uncharacterized protein n=1 Tax=termite gut metagenome TaxID=433724 RepID=A0A5J4QHP5_9ZZZZ
MKRTRTAADFERENMVPTGWKPFNGKAIYNPSGKAGEYSYWACNFYNGCSNGCTYCYLVFVRGDVSTKIYDSNGTLQVGISCKVRELQLLGGNNGNKPDQQPETQEIPPENGRRNFRTVPNFSSGHIHAK